jgi:hypothetical protein
MRASALNIYRRIEVWHGAPDPAYRGTGGPVFVQPPPDPNPIAPSSMCLRPNIRWWIAASLWLAAIRDRPLSPDFSFCVLGLDDFCGPFTDDDAGGHGVSGGDAGHDRAVGDAKVFYSIDFQCSVDHRHGVVAHLGGAGFVPVHQPHPRRRALIHLMQYAVFTPGYR